MFGSNVLDVGVGLILIYLILGLVCTSVNEYIAQIFSLRAQFLWAAITGLFKNTDGGKKFVLELYEHPLIASLKMGDGEKAKPPSYIPSHLFSLALTDKLGLHQSPNPSEGTPPSVWDSINVEGTSQVVLDTLRPLAVAAGNSIDSFRKNLELWYESAMDRATGWYRRRLQTITFCIAFVVVFISNADSLMLVDTLWSNPAERAALTAQAIKTNEAGKASESPGGAKALPEKTDPAIAEAQAGVSHLLGWSGPINWTSKAYQPADLHRFPAGAGWILKLFGLMITAFAASLGAPFWFGLLQKILQVRNGSAPPSSTPADVTRIESQTFTTTENQPQDTQTNQTQTGQATPEQTETPAANDTAPKEESKTETGQENTNNADGTDAGSENEESETNP